MKTSLIPRRFDLVLFAGLMLSGGGAHAQPADTNTPGEAVVLNGTSGFVTTTNVFHNPQTFTITVWFNTQGSTNGGRLVGFGDVQTNLSANYDRQIYVDASGHVVFGVNPGPLEVISNTTSVIDDNWHQAVGTLSPSSGLSLYLDGVQVTNHASFTSAQNIPNGWWKIGFDGVANWPNPPGSGFFHGIIDEVQIWSTALTSNEVVSNFHLFRAGTEPGLAAYYQFNEGTGTTTADSSGNGNTGTLQGGVTWISSTAPIGLPQVTNQPFGGSPGVFTADFSGVVLPNFQATAAWFEYGETTNYSFATPMVAVSAGDSTPAPVSSYVANLYEGTLYHFRLAATNSAGTNYSADLTFTEEVETPDVQTLAAIDITTDSAVLLAEVFDTNDPVGSVFASFNYGPTASYGSNTATVLLHGGLYFNGTPGNYVSVPNPTVPTGSNQYTIEAWIFANTQTNEGIAGWGNWGVSNGVHALGINASGIMVDWGSNALTQTGSTNLAGAWHHVASTYDGTNRVLYLDGNEVGTDVPPGTPSVTASGLEIGLTGGQNGAPAQIFDGVIDEVRIWNTALSQSVIQDNMNYGIVSFNSNYKNLMAYWTMNGVQGTNTTVLDLSTNQNNGVFVGSPVWTNGFVMWDEIIGLPVTNLTVAATTHFQAFVSNPHANSTGSDMQFATLGASTESATGITTNSATLNASVNTDGLTTGFYFEYGVTTNFGSHTSTSISSLGLVQPSVLMTNLAPETTYYFAIVATNSLATNVGQTLSFTTLPLPSITTGAATGLTTNTELLNAAVNPNGAPASVYFAYGLSTNLGSFSATNIYNGSNDVSVAITISNLTPGAIYYFQSFATNTNGTVVGGAASFEALEAPLVTTSPAQGIVEGGATLTGTVNSFGTDATVYFKYGLNGQLTNTTPAMVLSNGALVGNGSTGYVDIANEAPFRFNGPMTVEAWINVASFNNTWQAIVTKGDGSWRLHRHNVDNTVDFSLDGNSSLVDLDGVTDVNDGKWHHVAGVYDGTNMYLYVDGRLDASHAAPAAPLASNTFDVQIGENAQVTNRVWDGSIDEVRIWATNLSQTTISNWMFQSITTNHPNWSNLTGYYTFNDVEGTTVPDDSSHGNYGTLIGGAIGTGAPLTNNVFYLFDTLDNLLPGSNYDYQFVASNVVGAATGAELSWTNASATVPGAVTLAATLGNSNNATLNGLVQTFGLDTTVNFEYGTNTSYGSQTPASNLVASTGVSFSQTLDNLVGNTTYHYQIVASNAVGTNGGGDQSFLMPLFMNDNAGFPSIYGSVAWGDFNNDGRQDALLAGYDNNQNFYLQVWQNLGNGAFSNINVSLPGVANGTALWGDFDNDGRLDIFLNGASEYEFDDGFLYDDVTQIWHNNGDGTFSNLLAGLPGLSTGAAALADYNGDGRLDILLTGIDDDTSIIATELWRNDGGGSFTLVATGLPAVWYSSVAWGDFNNDGKPDILISGSTNFGNANQCITEVWQNMGNGTFSNINAGLPGLFDSSVAWGDFDNDGHPDILISGQNNAGNNQTQVWRNNGNGTFSNINEVFPAIDGVVAWGDVDNDGYLDILISGTDQNDNPYTAVWRNKGDGTFDTNFVTSLPQFGATLFFLDDDYSYYNGGVAWGDFDNDGRLDVMASGAGNASSFACSVFHNNTLASNTPPSAPTGLHVTTNGSTVTLNWSAATDAQTPAHGLTYNLRIGSYPGGENILSPESELATGRRLVPASGNAGETLANSAYGAGLPGGVYYWSVQAVDSAYAGSPFAPESSFIISNGVASITNLSAIPGATTAGVSANVNPIGAETFVFFEWGAGTNYTNSTTPQDIGDGLAFVPVSAVFSNLAPDTTYHWRAGAFSFAGSMASADQTFTTTAAPPAPQIMVFNGLTSILNGQTNVVNIGSAALGQTGPVLTFTVSNAGAAALILSNITVPSGFALAANPPTTIASGSEAAFGVQLLSTAIGGQSGSLVITNNDPAHNPFSFPISGFVFTKILAVSTGLSFGVAPVGDSVSNSFVITNTGTATLTVSNITYPFAAVFSNNWPGGAITPGASQRVNVTFTPASPTNYSGTVTIISDATSGNSAIPLTAFGANQSLLLTILTNGPGSVTPNEAKFIKAGAKVSLTAAPAGGNVFTGWSGSFNTGVNPLVFKMLSNTIVQANFVTNPFLPYVGTYNGLFTATNGDVTETNAGMIKGLTLTSKGTYSGSLLLNGASKSISGSFDAAGVASKSVSLGGQEGNVELVMTLTSNDPAPLVTGTVSNLNWLATNLTAYRAASNSLLSSPYTLLIPSDTNTASSPGGSGYALIAGTPGTAKTPATAKITGALADGTPFSQSVSVSLDSYVPIYANLYSSKGLLLGWINLTNASGNALYWVHPVVKSGLFQAEFASTNQILLSPWTNPPSLSALPTNLVVVDTANNIPVATNDFTITISNGTLNFGKLTGPAATLDGSIATKTGLVKMTIGSGASKTTGYGVILLNGTNGGGYFLTKTNAGSIILSP
jgi:hypothetical protein